MLFEEMARAAGVLDEWVSDDVAFGFDIIEHLLDSLDHWSMVVPPLLSRTDLEGIREICSRRFCKDERSPPMQR